MNIGAYIKKLREEKGYTQEQLGEKLGVQKAAVQKWESGKVVNLKRKTIQQLSVIFDVPPHSFFSEETSASETKKITTEELSDGEKMILELFRAIPDDKKQMAIEMLKAALQAH